MQSQRFQYDNNPKGTLGLRCEQQTRKAVSQMEGGISEENEVT
jgi:hypothetical protein